MKNIIKSVVGMAILACAGTSFAQNSANSTNDGGDPTANATVICRISLHKNSDLNFGKIVSNPNGTATVTAAGTESYSNGTDPGLSQHGAQTAASFTVTGQGGATYAITHTLPTAIGPMTLLIDPTPTVTSGTLGTIGSATEGCNGTQTYTYGGTVTQGNAGAPAGTYSATWVETVTYN